MESFSVQARVIRSLLDGQPANSMHVGSRWKRRQRWFSRHLYPDAESRRSSSYVCSTYNTNMPFYIYLILFQTWDHR